MSRTSLWVVVSYRGRIIKGVQNQADRDSADGRSERAVVSILGNPCLLPRQVLTTARVGLAQKEKIVKQPLLTFGGIAFIFAQLTLAESFNDFALLAGMPKGSLLLIPQILKPLEFAFEGFSRFLKRRRPD